MPIHSNMDATRESHTKWHKSERERQYMKYYMISLYEILYEILYDITYMWNLKYDTNELIHETETDSRTRTDLLLWGEGGGRDGVGGWA